MEVMVSLLAVIALILVLPFVRFFVKRISFYFRLKRVCKNYGARYLGNKFLWLFSTRNSSNCDFYVETSDVVYSVKLFESIIERTEITFINATTYSVKNFRWCILPYTWLTVKPKVHKLPEYNFEYKIKNEFVSKNIVPIMVILPLPGFRFNKTEDCKSELYDGTVISDQYTVYSAKGFLEKLRQTS